MTLEALVRLSVCALEATRAEGVGAEGAEVNGGARTPRGRARAAVPRLVVRGRTTGAGGLWADEPVCFVVRGARASRARRRRPGRGASGFGLSPYVEFDEARAGPWGGGDPRRAVPRAFRRPALGMAGLYGPDFEAAARELAARYVLSTYG